VPKAEPNRIVLLYRLRDGVDPEEYECWLREVERPLVARLDGIAAYSVTRLHGSPEETQLPYDYLEVLEVESPDAYRASVGADPQAAAFLEEWERRAAGYVLVEGSVVSETRATN
jgi:hypothetical protein